MASLADNWRACVRTPYDSSVWEDLLADQRFLLSRIAVRVAYRFGVTQTHEIDDAVQEICIKMSLTAREGGIPAEEDGAIEAYLKALIANTVHDYFRVQRARKRFTKAATAIGDGPQLEGGDESALESHVLLAQIDGLVQGNNRDRSVFGLYYQQGWTAKEIASVPSIGLSAKGVESLVYRLTTAIRKRME